MSLYWQDVLLREFGVRAELQRLDGELDLNFLALSPDGPDHVLKVMRQGCDPAFVDMQIAAMARINDRAPDCPVPRTVPAASGAPCVTVRDPEGTSRILWLQERHDGAPYAEFSPRTPDLIERIGSELASTDLALRGYDHPQLARPLPWNLVTSEWGTDDIAAITDPRDRGIISGVIKEFQDVKPALLALPHQAIHNDLNDYNILVRPSLTDAPDVSAIIDFGDMTRAPRLCNLAIAGAYFVLDEDRPDAALTALVRGYHAVSPLTAAETDLVVPLLRMRLAVSIIISTRRAVENPHDPYVTISQAPAWRFLQGPGLDPHLTKVRLRAACGLPATDSAPRINAFLNTTRGEFAPLFDAELTNVRVGDLSVEGSAIPRDPFATTPEEAQREVADDVWLGRYGEPRLIYTSPDFCPGPWKGSDRRTVHLGIDIFAPAGSRLHAPLAATIAAADRHSGVLGYGASVVLHHQTPDGDDFYSLYGHLDPKSVAALSIGDTLAKGQPFALLGSPEENGGWAPHVHLQLALATDGLGNDWPGVAEPDELFLWEALCPNPAALLNLRNDESRSQPTDSDTVHQRRQRLLGDNVRLSYRRPVMFVRGWRHHLFDVWGRPYLDAYNNVPHVGHAHPCLQAVAAEQLKRMNSNTRYLHPAQTAFAETLISKLPDNLSVCYFVNSGSEANELALRLARAHTGGEDMITPDHGYHGNTTGALAISAYKFNRAGGIGQADWVQLVEIADDYRGSFRRDVPDRAERFAAQVDDAIANIGKRGGKLAGFIAETFPSVGGQIIPPAGYLSSVYEKIRSAGGVCIADEVQTGLGRLGEYYFGFEQQNVEPDIVVLGKPIGNGHPIGVVVTTAAIADSFANGIEFFSTFGGSTLSCMIGKTVLDIVDEEQLQDNARVMGHRLMDGLRDLHGQHPCIGDVRGIGLFIGVELVTDHLVRSPATELADYVVNRLRDMRILIGVEGPDENVLKIRPPLTIDADGVDQLLAALGLVLSETAVRGASDAS